MCCEILTLCSLDWVRFRFPVLGPGWVRRSLFVPGFPEVERFLVPWFRVSGSLQARSERRRHHEPALGTGTREQELGTTPEPGSQPGTQKPEPGTRTQHNEFRV